MINRASEWERTYLKDKLNLPGEGAVAVSVAVVVALVRSELITGI